MSPLRKKLRKDKKRVMWGSMGFGYPGVTWGKLAVQLKQRENLET